MADKGQETREKLVETAQHLILQKGYAGTSLDDILKQTGLTKGAFFHHFKSKAQLGRAVVERFSEAGYELFSGFSEEADRLSDDPLERVLIFLRLFEAYLDDLGEPFPGCVYASYTYESRQFEPEVMALVRQRLEDWLGIYETKLIELFRHRTPRHETSPRALAEMIASLVEGGIVMANALNDAGWLQRQSKEYRRYLEGLFA